MRQEILCVVGTDKASFDIEAPADGVLLKTLYNEGSDSAVAESILSYRKRLQKAPEASGQRNISLNDLLMAL